MEGGYCRYCGHNAVYIYHTNEHCQVAGALHFDAPPAHLTECNVENCMRIVCEHCGAE